MNIQDIVKDASVVLGQGNTGALAAGGAVTGIVQDSQAYLAAKGAQIGTFLGQWGLNGLLTSASLTADKSNTNQAKALATGLFSNLQSSVWYLAAGAVGLFFLYKVAKSAIVVAAVGAAAIFVYIGMQPKAPTA